MNSYVEDESSQREARGFIPLSTTMNSYVPHLASSDEDKQKMFYAIRVKNAWERVASEEVLSHTDNIFVFMKEGVRTMICYVDMPIWAAELNANTMFYQMEMSRELGGSPIEVVKFITSKGSYRRQHFSKKVEETPEYMDDVPSIALTDEERARIELEAQKISSPTLRKALLEARIKDLEWKKGISYSKSRLRAPESL